MPRPFLQLVALLLALLVGCGGAVAPTPTAVAGPPDGFRGGIIAASQLPAEAVQTLALIQQRGPFPFEQDGAVFQNREGILPAQSGGYYHEYTVVTPGSADRGARRMVMGGAGERYYSDDHYDSFRFVVDP